MAMILNEEQVMLRDSAKDFCTNNTPITQLRELRDSNSATGFDSGTWSSMVELGWAGIPFPEEFGGLDFGYKGLGVVTQETGRTLTASPLIASVWTGGALLNAAGSKDQKAELLPKLAGGELLMALAIEESHRHNPYNIATSASVDGSGYKLDGKKTFVLDGHVADKLLVVARTGGDQTSRDGLSVFLVDRDASGVSVERTIMADSRNAANITLSGVAVGADALVGSEGQAADAIDQALDIARIGLAAEMLAGAKTPRSQYVLRDRAVQVGRA